MENQNSTMHRMRNACQTRVGSWTVRSEEIVFWDKVEIYRQQKKLTYRAIARAIGKAETTVSSMRQFGTEPRISDGIKIADALGVDIRDLAE